MTQNKPIWEEIKLCFRLIPYSVNWKMQLFASGLFMFVALMQFLPLFGDGSMTAIGGLYVVLAPMMSCQMLMILTYTGIVQSSTYKHRIQCKLFALQFLITVLMCYAVTAVIAIAMHLAGFMDSLKLAGFVLPFLGGLIFLIWYYPMIYKLGKSSFIVITFAFLMGLSLYTQGVIFGGIASASRMAGFLSGIPFGLMLFIPVPVVFLMTWLMYVVADRVYRKPLSEWYVLQAFKQASR